MFPISELASAYGAIRSTLFDDNDADRKLLNDMMEHLLFVTLHVQVGMGHLGIGFLTKEQERKNMLVRMDITSDDDDDDDDDDGCGGGGGVVGVGGSEDDGTKGGGASDGGRVDQTKGKRGRRADDGDITRDPSRNFRRSAPSFILKAVLPYMFQMIFFGELLSWSWSC